MNALATGPTLLSPKNIIIIIIIIMIIIIILIIIITRQFRNLPFHIFFLGGGGDGEGGGWG